MSKFILEKFSNILTSRPNKNQTLENQTNNIKSDNSVDIFKSNIEKINLIIQKAALGDKDFFNNINRVFVYISL